jgi:hypothetical protein
MIAGLPPAVFPIALILQAACSIGLAGVAWYRLLVHLPLLRRVDRRRLPRYVLPMETLEQFVIGPILLVETLSSLMLLLAIPVTIPQFYPAAGLALLVLIWVLSIAVARKSLHVLSRGFSAMAMRRVLCAAWVQSVAWTFRAVLILFIMLMAMRA